MKAIETILRIYRSLLELNQNGKIPIALRQKSIIGTTQDDPFDNWVQMVCEQSLGQEFSVYNTGKLQTPDLIIRHKQSSEVVGIEVKKLTQQKNGNDPRGWTIDFNSSLPCGRTIIQVGNDSLIIPLYYLFALLDQKNENIVTLILLDGDFLNFDLQLHKEAKTSNYIEYGHGPYGEGAIRHRKMYVYPNPLNSKLKFFHLRQVVVAKKSELEKVNETNFVTEEILRTDENNNVFRFLLKDESNKDFYTNENLPVLKDLFTKLKQRKTKDRKLSVPKIPRNDA